MDIAKLLDYLAPLANTEGSEAIMEKGITVALDAKDLLVKKTTTILDDVGNERFEIALRDVLVKKHPLEDNPVD